MVWERCCVFFLFFSLVKGRFCLEYFLVCLFILGKQRILHGWPVFFHGHKVLLLFQRPTGWDWEASMHESIGNIGVFLVFTIPYVRKKYEVLRLAPSVLFWVEGLRLAF